MGEPSTILKSARANQRTEDDAIVRLCDVRLARDLLWMDFYANLDSADTDRVRHKLHAWEESDNEVKRLEGKLGLLCEHHKRFATYQQLVDVGYGK